MMFAGMNVITSPLLEPKPKIQLSENYGGTDKVKAEMNAWLLEKFGREPAKVLLLDGGDTVVMAPSQAAQLRKELREIHPIFEGIHSMMSSGIGGLFHGF